jgi:hypothetical protein
MLNTRPETFVVPAREYDFTTAAADRSPGALVPSDSPKRTCFAVIRYTELLNWRKNPDLIPLACMISAGNIRGSSSSAPEKLRVADTANTAAKIKVLFISS